MIIVCVVNRHCELVGGFEFILEGQSNPYRRLLQKAITITATLHISVYELESTRIPADVGVSLGSIEL